MSRLAFRSNSNDSTVSAEARTPTAQHHIILEATVKPIGAGEYRKDYVAHQAAQLRSLRKEGKDIFEMNETRKVQSAGTLLYQTTETYGTSMSIEKIIEIIIQL